MTGDSLPKVGRPAEASGKPLGDESTSLASELPSSFEKRLDRLRLEIHFVRGEEERVASSKRLDPRRVHGDMAELPGNSVKVLRGRRGVARNVAKGRDDAAPRQDSTREGKGAAVQLDGNRVVSVEEVDENDVEGLVRTFEIGERVAHVDVGARIVEAALVKLPEVTLARVEDDGVELHHHDLLDARVAQHLAQGEAVAATFDQDAARRRMIEQRREGERFVVDELVVGEELDEAVEKEADSVARDASDGYFLEVGAVTKYPLFDA